MPREAAYTIEFFSRKRRGKPDRIYYFHIRATNGELVTPSQGYSRKVDRDQTAGHLRANLIEARMIDLDHGGQEVV